MSWCTFFDRTQALLRKAGLRARATGKSNAKEKALATLYATRTLSAYALPKVLAPLEHLHCRLRTLAIAKAIDRLSNLDDLACAVKHDS